MGIGMQRVVPVHLSVWFIQVRSVKAACMALERDNTLILLKLRKTHR